MALSTEERRSYIINYLRENGRATMNELASAFHVTRQTIYNDITVLSCYYPLTTKSGRYGSGGFLSSAFHREVFYLTPAEVKMIKRYQLTASLDDAIRFRNILICFAPSEQ